MLTVVCWKWVGWKAIYQPQHVHALQRMVKKYLQIPHRFVCVTDDPKGLNCETVRLWSDPKVNTEAGWPNCYRRLKMFSNYAKTLLGEKILSIDLDCVILKDITDLITDDDLKILSGGAAPYNGSLILHKPGTRTCLWDEFDSVFTPPEIQRHAKKTGVKYYGSDQAWIAYRCPNEPTWTREDGIWHYTAFKGEPIPENARIVFFSGREKLWSSTVKKERPDLWKPYMWALGHGNG